MAADFMVVVGFSFKLAVNSFWLGEDMACFQKKEGKCMKWAYVFCWFWAARNSKILGKYFLVCFVLICQ
jgi:hypothetical protein